jgi:hypothetical protein
LFREGYPQHVTDSGKDGKERWEVLKVALEANGSWRVGGDILYGPWTKRTTGLLKVMKTPRSAVRESVYLFCIFHKQGCVIITKRIVTIITPFFFDEKEVAIGFGDCLCSCVLKKLIS